MDETPAPGTTPPADEEIRALLTVLRRCRPVDAEPAFDAASRTLALPLLDCSPLDERELAAFHILHHLHGDLLIRNNRGLANLDGLRNLQTVTGRLELVGGALRQLSGLTRLRRAGSVTIAGMDQLTEISGLTSLASCSEGLTIRGNPLLTRLSGFTSLAAIDNGSLTLGDCPRLVSACGLIGLTSVRQTLVISNCPALADFRFLAGLGQVHDLEISNTALVDTSPLRPLFALHPRYKGAIRISRNRDLADLSFLAGLTSVGSSLYLDNNRLADLRGLEGLRRVGASLNLSGNALTDITQLARLEEVNGILLLAANRLTSLHGLENLRRLRTKKWGKVEMTLRLDDNRDAAGQPCLTDIGALANVVEATGRMLIYADSESGHRYQVKPGVASIFATRNRTIEVFGHSHATRLPRSHVCDTANPPPVPILFPDMSRAWQEALARCPGIAPHFLPFRSVAEIAALCRAHAIAFVAAIKLSSQRFLAEHATQLRSHDLRFLANEPQTLANCENKQDFKQFMDGHGFAAFTPATYRRPEEVRYPCIVKPAYGSFGKGQRIVNTPGELGPFPGDALVCEYISGPVEYATNFFFLDRANFLEVTYRKTYSRPSFILGQDPYDQFRNEKVACAHLDQFLDILEALRYRGICCFDYKPAPSGPKIFEINARIGFTLASHPDDLKRMLDLYLDHAR